MPQTVTLVGQDIGTCDRTQAYNDFMVYIVNFRPAAECPPELEHFENKDFGIDFMGGTIWELTEDGSDFDPVLASEIFKRAMAYLLVKL